MSKALVFLAPGFEEIEEVTIIDVLRRAKVKVTVAGLIETPIEGAHKLHIVPEKSVESVLSQEYDAVVCPGGSPGYINLRNDQRVIKLIKNTYAANKLVAAICAGPAILADAGVLKGKHCTIYPGMENELLKGGGKPSQENVVVDANVVTSRGPATAMLFALKLAEMLSGKQVSDSVAQKLLASN